MKNETQKVVTLSTPIKRGEKEFAYITVIKPTVAALKGLKMFDVLQMDVDALQILLPRVTQPMLHKNDFVNMDVADFTELVGAAISFLGKNSAEEEPTEEVH